jgi:hypothetical protein
LDREAGYVADWVNGGAGSFLLVSGERIVRFKQMAQSFAATVNVMK